MDPAELEGHEHAVHSLLQNQLEAVLGTLSEREESVVRLRYGLDDGEEHTLEEIGTVWGVTRERIRQVQSKAMSKLRHRSRSEVLRDYFEGIEDPELVTDDSGSELVTEPEVTDKADSRAETTETAVRNKLSSRPRRTSYRKRQPKKLATEPQVNEKAGSRVRITQGVVANKVSPRPRRPNFPKWQPKTDAEWERWFAETGVADDRRRRRAP
jgi:hypothetical protein